MSDKEQIQAFKDWWKKNGKTILFGIVLFFILNTSMIYIKNYNIKYKTNASNTYTRLIASQSENKPDEVKLFANDLTQKYSRSVYASLGMLMLAKNEVDSGKLDNAVIDLQWIINKNKDKKITQIAKIRAARILLSQNKPNEALATLHKINDQAYVVEVLELKGDIALAMQNKKDAAKFYQQAFDDSAKLEIQAPLLSMKLNAI